MRVAIDTRSLRPPLTGIGHFVHRLVDAMVPLLAPEEKLLSFNGWRIEPLDRDFLIRIGSLNSELAPGGREPPFREVANTIYGFLRRIYPVRRGVRGLQEYNFHKAKKDFDLFHAANYVPPGSFDKPVLPIIYDLSHVRFPQAHPRERVDWLEKQLKLLVDVPYVQTISEFSKSEIVAVLGIPPARVHVTYPAPGVDFRSEREADDTCLAEYNAERFKYFLVVGAREPRKNFKTVAEAYTALPAPVQAQFPLLWAGPPGWGDLSLSRAVERAKELGRIRIIGYVSDRDLAALYRNTILFVMPSIYEGFGMPVVEAMACGARIALSRIPVFEEIAGKDARYVDPMDVEGWRQAIKDAIDEGPGLLHRGPPPDLTRFSWLTSAATTLDLYRRLAACRT
jgi:glycosyltransferase involved in cell wall biosynthesis